MDEAETRITPDIEGETPTDDTVSNGDLANRRRRQQVRQACQQCRRRKIKCDETRPVCRPCVKAKLACAYELPPGQTRAQAMLESQQRLRDELHSHTSLIHSLRCADTNASIQMLGRLRQGDYDGALLGTDPTTRPNPQGDRVYPWEETADESQRHRHHSPQFDVFQPTRQENSVYLIPHQAPAKAGPSNDGNAVSTHPHAMDYSALPGLPAATAMMDCRRGSFNTFQPGVDAYQQLETHYQPHSTPRYQTGGPGFQHTLPSNDSQRHYPGSR